MSTSFNSSFKVQDNNVILNWPGENVSANFAIPVSSKEKELFKSLTMNKHFPENDFAYANLANVLLDGETDVKAILTENQSGLSVDGDMNFVQPGSAVYFTGLSPNGELTWKDDAEDIIKSLNPRSNDDLHEGVENWVNLSMEGVEPEMTEIPEPETEREFKETDYEIHDRKAIPYLDFGGNVRLYINQSDEGILRQKYLEGVKKAAEEGDFGHTNAVSPSEIKAEYNEDIESIQDLEILNPSAIIVNMFEDPDIILDESGDRAQFYLEGSDYAVEMPRSVALTYIVSEGEEVGLTHKMAEYMRQEYSDTRPSRNSIGFE